MNSVCIEQLLDVGIALSKQKDRDSLLERILTAAMNITASDGGTLYIRNEDTLNFKLMITKSTGTLKGSRYGPICLPPVKLSRENVCARAAIDGRLINIPDAYETEKFDFSGPRSYDALTGYRTSSMLVVPMEDDTGAIIGVLQLLNAKDSKGNTIRYRKEFEPMVLSLASQAAICLTNMNYASEIRELLESFARVISTAIEARMPYNASHTRNMVLVATQFLNWLDTVDCGWHFSEVDKHQFLLSVWLHDIGKLAIPQEIMDKGSRLGPLLDAVQSRFCVIGLLDHIAMLEGSITKEEYSARTAQLEKTRDLVHTANRIESLPADLRGEIDMLTARTYLDEDGAVRPWLTHEERDSLTIPYGTLTPDERAIMRSHVVMTEKMLGEMKFAGDYINVPEWAVEHHEFLDGSGYPKGLSGDQIPKEARLLTILDIFDALTALDRPYKAPMPVEKALPVLREMADSGKLDPEILTLFEESHAWEGKL